MSHDLEIIETIFAVQDDTGTVTQVFLQASPPVEVEVGDTGIYSGIPDNGTPLSGPAAFRDLPFTVLQVIGVNTFTVRTTNANMADWPADGAIVWQTGINVGFPSVVTDIQGANAYISIAEFKTYHNSRGNSFGSATDTSIKQAIVKSTDYIDQKYRFSGVKLLQTIGSNTYGGNPTYGFIESWLTPYVINSVSYLTPTTSKQTTEWPRQGVVDNNGNTVNGIPKHIKGACAELAIRVLNGVQLQPDYDPNVVAKGGVISSVTKKLGPLETSFTFDTKAGIGFFASFPQVDRLLSSGGLLRSGGGRSLIR